MSGPAKKGKALASRLSKLERENETGTVLPVGDAGDRNYTQPAKYFEADDRDDYYETKARITEDDQKLKLGTTVQITEEDIKYIQDQKTKEELKLYDEWFQNTYIMGSDPNKIALGRRMNPDWFKRREENIKREVSITGKLAKLSLRGPRSQEDLEVLYALQSGRIAAPDLDYLFPQKSKNKINALTQANNRALIQGYFNPRKYSTQYGPVTPTPFAPGTNYLDVGPGTHTIADVSGNRQSRLFGRPAISRQ